MKDKIVNILMEELNYVYCYNCRINELDEEDEDWNCDFCHRKNMNWELSKKCVEGIAEDILDIINK